VVDDGKICDHVVQVTVFVVNATVVDVVPNLVKHVPVVRLVVYVDEVKTGVEVEVAQ
jgi:hypothetical protein